jgi:hypothetical protein
MKEGNVIDFAARRPGSGSENAVRTAERDLNRSSEADALLRKLRDTKRLAKADQSALVTNLGRLIELFDPENAKSIVRRILETNEWEKRKRYIRFANDPISRVARHAASGGSFARIIDRLIDVRVCENIDRNQAKIEIVRKALKRTSFLPPSSFQMPEGKDDAEAAQFAADMKKVTDKLAEEADLADFFTLVSKHPIYPSEAWYQWTNSLELNSKHEPNHVYEWGWEADEDEIQDWIPWWAPRCLIGHWYIPFHCKRVRVPEQSVAEIRKKGGSRPERYMSRFSPLIEPFISSEWMSRARVYHRLPVWLIVLPLPNRLVPCLYVAIHHPGGFYPNHEFPSDDDPVSPCFVEKIGGRISDDSVFLRDDDDDNDYDTLYVHVSEKDISAIGSRVDDSLPNFKSDLLFADMTDELPGWLQEHPVQRFLKLTTDSESAMSFALVPHKFTGRKWDRGDETIFRPAFPDAAVQHWPEMSQDTIATYLLRNLVNDDGASIFLALNNDAVVKQAAARDIINSSVSMFRQAFDEKFGK